MCAILEAIEMCSWMRRRGSWKLEASLIERVKERGWLSGSVSPRKIGNLYEALLRSPAHVRQRPRPMISDRDNVMWWRRWWVDCRKVMGFEVRDRSQFGKRLLAKVQNYSKSAGRMKKLLETALRSRYMHSGHQPPQSDRGRRWRERTKRSSEDRAGGALSRVVGRW
jgi:hypothetical protein